MNVYSQMQFLVAVYHDNTKNRFPKIFHFLYRFSQGIVYLSLFDFPGLYNILYE